MATSIRLSPELSSRLDRLAARTGRTKAFYLRQIIENGIGEMEDYYLAADTLERVRKGQEKVFSSASVRKDLGLDDSTSPMRAGLSILWRSGLPQTTIRGVLARP
jgi:RHH-type rel operon transcriptional repressor/antitoxin RelB